MTRRLLTFLLAAGLLCGAAPVGGQVTCVGGGCAAGATVTSPVATDPLSLTGAVTFDNAANTPLVCSDGLQDSTLTAGRLTFAGTAGRLSDSAVLTGGSSVATNGTSNFLRVVGTLPAIPTAQANGVDLQVTGAGSAAQVQTAFQSSLLAGYTGASGTYGGLFTNVSVGSGGNTGVFGSATGTTGTIQVRGVYGQGGSGGLNVTGVGLAGLGNGGLSAIGADLTANTATNQIGLRATLGLTPSTATSAVILADNASVAAPIAIFRDNGTAVHTIQDGGSEYRLQATKTLTESTDTTFVRVAVASGARTGGAVFYCLNAADASDHQERCGSVPFAVVNKAGTETCAVGTASDVVAVSAGTLTVTWNVNTATPTNGCDLMANAVSSLTQTTLNLSYTVTLTGAAASAVTPQ